MLLLLGSSLLFSAAAHPENLLAPECRFFDVTGLGGRDMVGLWRDQGKRWGNLQHSPMSSTIPSSFSPELFSVDAYAVVTCCLYNQLSLEPKSWHSKSELYTTEMPAHELYWLSAACNYIAVHC